jgi:hypothetical protein
MPAPDLGFDPRVTALKRSRKAAFGGSRRPALKRSRKAAFGGSG